MEAAISHPDVDVVCIALPNNIHEIAVMLCCKHKKAVMTTKPLGRNGEEAKRMLIAVEEAGIFNGYLEDLDFSLELKKRGKLMVCSNAKYTHDQSITRPGFEFGKKELRNRYYIVKKHNLKKNLFFLTSLFRMILTLKEGIFGDINSFKRLAGNLVALFTINNLDKNY
jgi:hypothetical protein